MLCNTFQQLTLRPYSVCVPALSSFVRVARKSFLLLIFLAAAVPLWASETFNWRTNENRVTADIHSLQLSPLLERIASATSWQVYLEPDTTHIVSTKFKDLAPGEALRLLLGNLNFA